MVLGLRSRHRKGASVQVDYLVHVNEIKPWPPSQSLRSVQSVLLQWENGDQNFGSLASGVGDCRIEFNESFTLPLTLRREKRTPDKFQKNQLEFHLYESRKDKAVKGQLLGTAIINLAEYGIVEEILTLSAPVNCKKTSKSMAQPVLFVKIESVDKDSSNSSPKGILSKGSSVDKDGEESVSELMNEENDDEYEIASFTDDDVSSQTISSSVLEALEASSSQYEKNGSESASKSTRRAKGEPTLPLVNPMAEVFEQRNGSSQAPSTMRLSSGLGNPVDNHIYLPQFPERSMTSLWKKSISPSVQSSFSLLGSRDTNEEPRNLTISSEQVNTGHDCHEDLGHSKGKIDRNAQPPAKDNFADRLAAKVSSSDAYIHAGLNSDLAKPRGSQASGDDNGQDSHQRKSGLEAPISNDVHVGTVDCKEKKEQQEIRQDKQILEKKHSSDNKPVGKFSQDATRKPGTSSEFLTFSRSALGVQGTTVTNNKLQHVKSVQLPFDSAKANEFCRNGQKMEKTKKIEYVEDANNNITSNAATESKEPRNGFSNSKIEWESRIEMLEEELREAAAVEVGLYSVIAEHGGSTNKVHSPARRLSRFYLRSCKAQSQAKRASAARAAISGLVLVSKACGNDVPRLTFWLSNSIMLRAIVSQVVGEMSLSDGPCIKGNSGGTGSDGRSPQKWDGFRSTGEEKNNSIDECDDWENQETFTLALENVEAWIFSRIVESVWWQTLTPHMQSTAAKGGGRTMGSSSRKTYGSGRNLGDQEQGNFSAELWKKAFKDACERLCPIRAGGHECGCLPVLARLVMEQLVDRLDVAMFNAILRESGEEMPTDPVSDPISDSKVLPIPAGKSSFGAGAQLKNAIGNWSRWLTDLFGIEDNDSPEDSNNLGDYKRLECDTSFKAFRLLNALSDLMMLPFGMLADASTRKEVCPTFGPPLIKRVLNNFVPDEFCPDPIPEAVFEDLDSEDVLEAPGESLTSFPCIATPTVYSPPPAASLATIIGEVGSQTLHRSGSALLRKSYTSDDELDELDSPLTSIILDKLRVSPTLKTPKWMPKGKGGRKVVRYQLLRESWRDVE